MIDHLTIDGREVPIVIDGACPWEGTVEWNSNHLNEPTTPKRIVLRAWDERVLLHEALHCLLGDNEQIVRRASLLHELGWRCGVAARLSGLQAQLDAVDAALAGGEQT